MGSNPSPPDTSRGAGPPCPHHAGGWYGEGQLEATESPQMLEKPHPRCRRGAGWGKKGCPWGTPVPVPSHSMPDTRQQSTLPGEPVHHRKNFPPCLCPRSWRFPQPGTTSQSAPLTQANSAPYRPQAAECRPLEEGPAQAPQTQRAPNRKECKAHRINSLCRATDTTTGGDDAWQRRTLVCCQKRTTERKRHSKFNTTTKTKLKKKISVER